ncbi:MULTISPECIES: flagellar biosynthesis protein FlhB [Bacillaceae]|uniref:flagellar biosynthesis protein FlhB n=1 Tax=Anoxybacillaceae TaxID=3120669 RepID=UPI000D38EC41|nr:MULTISPECIES: flagellar biosynthesis protein FlhB [Bacillaceae]QNU34034.1 flagellar biosynthesis protein FlhB [Geobacillus sp. 44C]MED4989875.1 flagellar biosynthesis protein FlhB [Parageobacillus toebii]PUF88979.1 flagellar biosynthesis protein FlhB [Geobacillus sp. LYN3]RDV22041.1 flagellar biosynthesis protein FlhB [Parageobacillus toebii]TXK89375.1 flagellar biosynthesis protein FlhB [Geobacillus sp. AYS3]
MNELRLDLQFFAGEKTEKATPRKRQEVREKGQVAKSADINTAIVMLVVFLVLYFLGTFYKEKLLHFMYQSFEQYARVDLTIDSVHRLSITWLKNMAMLVAPIFFAAVIAACLANFLQVGFLFTTEPLKMKWNRLDPVQGFKRMISLRAIVELLKSLLKISVVGLVTFALLWFQIDHILSLTTKSISTTLSSLASLTAKMGLYASSALLFLAIFDYLYQRFDFEKNIRMSKQDIKDEYKKTEGDPLIKSKIKQKQREMAMRRMMQEVPKADVVITNPTHYAVALKYEDGKMDAPMVVAKGVDYVALKIKQLAKEHDVVTVENRPLAQALYRQTEVGDMIPEEFFKAVAEILAYVYRLKRKV